MTDDMPCAEEDATTHHSTLQCSDRYPIIQYQERGNVVHTVHEIVPALCNFCTHMAIFVLDVGFKITRLELPKMTLSH